MKEINKDSIVPVVTVPHHERIKSYRLKGLSKGKCHNRVDDHVPSLQQMFKDSLSK